MLLECPVRFCLIGFILLVLTAYAAFLTNRVSKLEGRLLLVRLR